MPNDMPNDSLDCQASGWQMRCSRSKNCLPKRQKSMVSYASSHSPSSWTYPFRAWTFLSWYLSWGKGKPKGNRCHLRALNPYFGKIPFTLLVHAASTCMVPASNFGTMDAWDLPGESCWCPFLHPTKRVQTRANRAPLLEQQICWLLLCTTSQRLKLNKVSDTARHVHTKRCQEQ